jgi:hypothetical protein
MDKKNNKKDNKNIPNKHNQNNINKLPKKNTLNNLRPSSKGKQSNNNSINSSKKTNTPKKIAVKNLNECAFPQKESNNSNIKNIPKKVIKKDNNTSNKNTSETSIKNINIIDQISNLTSLYNALSFINNKLDSTFSSQKKKAEQSLHNKYSEAIELKENNFKLYQKINSMNNIINIDDYFMNNYSKMMAVYPKVSNVVENMNDIVSNINYGIDRMYLVDDLLCDENILQQNIIKIKNDFEIMNNNIQKKIDEINGNKTKYDELYNKINLNEEETKKIENKLDTFKQDVLTNNIEIIYQILSDKNQKILNEILNE